MAKVIRKTLTMKEKEDSEEEEEEEEKEEKKEPKDPEMISRNVCIIVLQKALAALQNLSNTTTENFEPDVLFANILHHHAVQDQQWFQQCIESYTLNGDDEITQAYTLLTEKVRTLTEAPPLDEDSIREDDSIHYDDDIDYVEQYRSNQRKLDLVGKMLRGEIVTDRQRQRRQERAENRIRRAEIRVAKMRAKLDLPGGSQAKN